VGSRILKITIILSFRRVGLCLCRSSWDSMGRWGFSSWVYLDWL